MTLSQTTSSEKAQGLAASVERHLKIYFAAHDEHPRSSGLYDVVLQEVEKPLLRLALDECRGNQLRAAALLGLNRNTLRKKIRALGLETGRKRPVRKGEP